MDRYEKNRIVEKVKKYLIKNGYVPQMITLGSDPFIAPILSPITNLDLGGYVYDRLEGLKIFGRCFSLEEFKDCKTYKSCKEKLKQIIESEIFKDASKKKPFNFIFPDEVKEDIQEYIEINHNFEFRFKYKNLNVYLFKEFCTFFVDEKGDVKVSVALTNIERDIDIETGYKYAIPIDELPNYECGIFSYKLKNKKEEK